MEVKSVDRSHGTTPDPSNGNDEGGQKRSPAQVKASRQNGRKSKGPLSSESKARSARGAVKHGILTAHVCADESPEQQRAYAKLLEDLLAEFQASSTMERLLVERLAAAQWRIRRVLDFEVGTALERNNAPGDFLADLQDEYGKTEPADPKALERGHALSRSLPPEGALDRAMRYEAHLTRETSRLLSQLEHVRRTTALDQ